MFSSLSRSAGGTVQRLITGSDILNNSIASADLENTIAR
jgi:hypothetical protein